MSKVILTQEQAESLELILEKANENKDLALGWISPALHHRKPLNKKFSSLKELSVGEVARALYIGYEVEPEFKVDDSADMEDKARLIATLESLYRDGVLDGILRYAKEQAERVEELEEENRFQMSETHKNLDKVIYLDKENQRYKQALEFYAERDNYTTNIRDDNFNYHQAVFFDNGERARQALEESE